MGGVNLKYLSSLYMRNKGEKRKKERKKERERERKKRKETTNEIGVREISAWCVYLALYELVSFHPVSRLLLLAK